MDYNHITNFFDKFKKLICQKEETQGVVVETISSEINHQLENRSIKIKSGYIYIQSSPTIRCEIMMHKKQILDKLKRILPSNTFLDIK